MSIYPSFSLESTLCVSTYPWTQLEEGCDPPERPAKDSPQIWGNQWLPAEAFGLQGTCDHVRRRLCLASSGSCWHVVGTAGDDGQCPAVCGAAPDSRLAPASVARGGDPAVEKHGSSLCKSQARPASGDVAEMDRGAEGGRPCRGLGPRAQEHPGCRVTRCSHPWVFCSVWLPCAGPFA